MNTSVISGDDIRFLVQQSPEQLTTIMGQMTSLMEGISNLQDDTNNRVTIMENQKWYQRMAFNITGKNKASKNEIKKNQDRIVSYVSEAVASLYQMNCIEMQSICSLGNRINQVYAELTNVYNGQLQMKAQITEIQAIQQKTIQSLGKFVSTLNQKIESIDNYHMLLTEIQQKKYCDKNKIVELCRVLSQLDKRVVDDDRKLSILREAVVQSEMIDDTAVPIRQFLNDVLTIPEDKIGIVYLELCNYRSCFPSNLFVELIEKYHFLSKMEKLSKRKDVLIQMILDQYMIDGDIEFTYSDIYDSFIEHKKMSFVDEIRPALEAKTSSDNNNNYFYQESKEIKPDKSYSDDEVNSLADKIENKISNKEKIDQEFNELKSIAENGNYIAQFRMGVLFYPYKQGGILTAIFSGIFKNTKGVAGKVQVDEHKTIIQDYSTAFDWVEKSANQGYAKAQYELAVMYENGYGTNKDITQAIAYYEMAAYQEYADAQEKLGILYYYGDEVTQDYDMAKKWFTAAVKNGNSFAQEYLDKISGSDISQSKTFSESYSSKSASSILDKYIHNFPNGSSSKAYNSQEIKDIPDKIAMAKKKFGYRSDGEVIGLLDQSAFGKGKRGILFTDTGLAFDHAFSKVFVRYEEIDSIVFTKKNKEIELYGNFKDTNGYIPMIDNIYTNLNELKTALEELSRFKKYGY